jgi:hypothetical protein
MIAAPNAPCCLLFKCKNTYFKDKGRPEAVEKDAFNAKFEAFVESGSEFSAYYWKIKIPIT